MIFFSIILNIFKSKHLVLALWNLKYPKGVLVPFLCQRFFCFWPIFELYLIHPSTLQDFHKKNKHWTVVAGKIWNGAKKSKCSANPLTFVSSPFKCDWNFFFWSLVRVTWYTQSWVIIFELKGPTVSCFYIFWWSSKYYYTIMNCQPSSSILFYFHRYSQKIEKMSHFVLTILSNFEKRWDIFFKICGLLKIPEL